MEENFVLNGNKLIYEYMGSKWNPIEKKVFLLKFHKSWDWLMKVVIKILIQCKDDYPDQYGHWTKRFKQNTASIEGYYKVVLEYIEWYNEKK